MIANIWRRMPSFYNLEGSKCSKCTELCFPNSMVCKKCGSTEMGPFQFSGKGTVETYTIIRQPFNEESIHEKLVLANPYIISIIRLEEGPMITAQITDLDEKEVKMGMKVTAVLRKISEDGEDGIIRYGYKFIPQN